MSSKLSMTETRHRCTLCPAGCQVEIVTTGPDAWRTEFPARNAGGVCPRGAILGQLVGHRSRVLSPARRVDGQWRQVDLDAAIRAVLDEAKDRTITFFLDGNIPVESMLAAGAWCSAWPQARLCLVIEPADEQTLLGVEASGANYLATDALADCDGFLMIGDVFAANPACSRGVFDRRSEEPRTPIVCIDPACAAASKFASHLVETAPGAEWTSLSAMAPAAGVASGTASNGSPSAAAAGKALAECKRLAVLIAPDYGRTNAWRQIGRLAGEIARARGGGVAVQTVGANALAAVRLRERVGAVTPAEALLLESSVKVAAGCDVLGMLGWKDSTFFAAAVPFVDRTAQGAQVLLPVAVTGETGGHFASADGSLMEAPPLMAPPAGVPGPAGLIADMARAAGVSTPKVPSCPKSLERINVQQPQAVPTPTAPAERQTGTSVLLIARQAMHSGCGSLTSHGSWQQGTATLPELRMSAQDAAETGVKNEAVVTVSVGEASVKARVLVTPELPGGRLVLTDGFPEVRQLLPGTVDRERNTIFALPQTASIQL